MESVEAAIVQMSTAQAKNEELIVQDETTEIISIQKEAETPPKSINPSFLSNSYNLSTLALLFIAIVMSATVLNSPSQKTSIRSKNLNENLEQNEIIHEHETESSNDVNSSFIQPELSKFEFIHGQLKDLSICLILYNITDMNGACLVHNPKSFYAASEACVSHNMTLLEFDTDHDKRRVFEETEKIFGTGGGTRIWMNGKFSAEVNGFLALPKNEKMSIKSDEIEGGFRGSFTEGECLAIESWYSGRYHISSVPCRGEHYFYCEF